MSFTAEEAGLEVLKVASQFLDLYEVKPNAQWSEPVESETLKRLMKEAGWQEGWPYCAAFVEACVVMAYRRLGASDEALKVIRSRFSPSVMQTFVQVGTLGQQRKAVPGSVFFMQKGGTGLGHAGLVVLGGRRTFVTIEGNTSPGVVDTASDREGDGIYAKVRRLSWTKSPKGLWLRGFLHPMGSAELDDLVRKLSRTS
jgi:hypothetical protein